MSEELRPYSGNLSEKEMLAQDLKAVDLMTRWRKKLSKGESIRYKVMDKGMMPALNIGDVAEIQPVQTTNLKTNNIIFFRQNENFIFRRIVECVFSGNGEFKVKGDNQTDFEPLVSASQIIGKVVAYERDGKKTEIEKSFASAFSSFNKKFAKTTDTSSRPEFEKGKEMASSVFRKVVEVLDKAYAAIISVVDKIVEKMSRR